MEAEWNANGGLMGMLGMTGQLAFEQKSTLNIDFVSDRVKHFFNSLTTTTTTNLVSLDFCPGEDMQMMMQMMEMKAHCKCTSSDVAYGEMAMPTVPMAAGKK